MDVAYIEQCRYARSLPPGLARHTLSRPASTINRLSLHGACMVHTVPFNLDPVPKAMAGIWWRRDPVSTNTTSSPRVLGCTYLVPVVKRDGPERHPGFAGGREEESGM